MALIIKSLFGMFWVFSSTFLVFLIYIVMQTESDPSLRWAWMIMAVLTFAGASLLAYIVISAGNNTSEPAHEEAEEIESSSNNSSEPDTE
jgi:hypothetical protein